MSIKIEIQLQKGCGHIVLRTKQPLKSIVLNLSTILCNSAEKKGVKSLETHCTNFPFGNRNDDVKSIFSNFTVRVDQVLEKLKVKGLSVKTIVMH